jgi:TRAP-type C4-dicarboxylate transport system substrate-binding protein
MIGGAGTIDMSRVATYSLNSYGSKSLSLLSVPYTFTGRDHFWKVARSELGAKLLDESSKLGLGVKGLFYAEEGFRHFFFNSKVESIADLAGKKIRVSNDPIMTGMVGGLKASPTVVSFTELYSALQTKVVDGAEQPIVNYQSNSFFEVAPYMILDGHTLGCAEVIITESAWGKLTDGQKGFITEAGKYASEFNANLSAKIENDCKAELTAKGVTFAEVKDLKAWQDACADVIAQFSKGMEDDYKAILDMAR